MGVSTLKLAFSTLGCPELTLPQIVKLAELHQMDGVELRGFERTHISPKLSASERADVRTMFSDSGLEIACISAYTKFVMPSEEQRKENERVLLEYVQLAEEVGCPYIRTFIGKLPDAVKPNELQTIYDYIAESLDRVGNALAHSSVKILIETHDSWSMASSIKPILDRIDSPAIDLLWDTMHSYRAGEELDATYALVGDRIRHVHLKDEYTELDGKRVHCFPGEGRFPIRSCLQLLKKHNYDGYLCLEWERTWHPEMPELASALPRFKTWLNQD
jgi:sugar phosphate isomerase/epimerase